MTEFGRAIRSRFLLEPGIAFLNHGSFGTIPRDVYAVADDWRLRFEANPDRFIRETLPPALREAVAQLAPFFRARAEDIVFVDNATAGVNAVLRSLDFAAGDEILTTDHAYGAVANAIRYVATRSGATAVFADIAMPATSAEAIYTAITSRFTSRTRLLVIDHITSATALIHPLSISHDYDNGFTEEFDWTGTRDPAPFLSAPAGLDFLKSLGVERVQQHNRSLALAAAQRMAQRWGEPMNAPPELLGAMASVRLPPAWQKFGPPGRTAARLLCQRILQRDRIMVAIMPWAGALWARVSAQIYNEPADYDGVVSFIDREPPGSA